MKQTFAILAALLAVFVSAQAADSSVKLSNVHLCCEACVKGVAKALGNVAGAKAECDRDAKTISLTAADKATVQKSVDALVAAGYFGTSSDPSIKVAADSGAKAGKVSSLKVAGVHLCCKQCVNAVNETLGKVSGVKGNTAARNAESFEVTGDFEPKEVFTALNKSGLAGKVSDK